MYCFSRKVISFLSSYFQKAEEELLKTRSSFEFSQKLYKVTQRLNKALFVADPRLKHWEFATSLQSASLQDELCSSANHTAGEMLKRLCFLPFSEHVMKKGVRLALQGGGSLQLTSSIKMECLLLACERGNLTMVQAMLDMGAGLNDKLGRVTPLMMAVVCGHKEVVSHLLSRGAMRGAINAGESPEKVFSEYIRQALKFNQDTSVANTLWKRAKEQYGVTLLKPSPVGVCIWRFLENARTHKKPITKSDQKMLEEMIRADPYKLLVECDYGYGLCESPLKRLLNEKDYHNVKLSYFGKGSSRSKEISLADFIVKEVLLSNDTKWENSTVTLPEKLMIRQDYDLFKSLWYYASDTCEANWQDVRPARTTTTTTLIQYLLDNAREYDSWGGGYYSSLCLHMADFSNCLKATCQDSTTHPQYLTVDIATTNPLDFYYKVAIQREIGPFQDWVPFRFPDYAQYLQSESVRNNKNPTKLSKLCFLSLEKYSMAFCVKHLLHNTKKADVRACLRLAAERGNVPMIECLLEEGVEANDPQDDISPLFIAALCGHGDAMKALMDHGADVVYEANNPRVDITTFCLALKTVNDVRIVRRVWEQTPLCESKRGCESGEWDPYDFGKKYDPFQAILSRIDRTMGEDVELVTLFEEMITLYPKRLLKPTTPFAKRTLLQDVLELRWNTPAIKSLKSYLINELDWSFTLYADEMLKYELDSYPSHEYIDGDDFKEMLDKRVPLWPSLCELEDQGILQALLRPNNIKHFRKSELESLRKMLSESTWKEAIIAFNENIGDNSTPITIQDYALKKNEKMLTTRQPNQNRPAKKPKGESLSRSEIAVNDRVMEHINLGIYG